MFLFLSGMSNWRAGWCVGPRYIATVAPFLLLGIAKLWPQLRRHGWAVALVAGLTVPSVVLNVVSGALYPHYPEQFDNPVFDLAFPLIGAGYTPRGLGFLLGLRGGWAMLPLGLVVTSALAIALAGDAPSRRAWARQLALSLAVATVFLLALSAYGRKPRADEAHATATVRQLWDPPEGAPTVKN
jgi:peptidoglycan/LPS O-acetylase OafA/YrhL